MVHDLDVVDQADEDVRVELLDLVQVEGREQAVAPAERRVRVDDDVVQARGVGPKGPGSLAEAVDHGSREPLAPAVPDKSHSSRWGLFVLTVESH